jgi:hypothetical protein
MAAIEPAKWRLTPEFCIYFFSGWTGYAGLESLIQETSAFEADRASRRLASH